MIQNFKLINKKNLTNNVFELKFEWEKELEIKPGQFITFLLDKIWWRAYSILKIEWVNVILMIKKWELDEWGRGWSKYICDLNVWDKLRWVWPAWHFVLQESNKNKMFIWTGTWLVPLYNQIIWAIDKKLDAKLKLIFWLREIKDIFYTNELNSLKENNPNFDYDIYLSRAEYEWTKKWYVTDYLTSENVSEYEEFYICGMPSMIDSTIEKLKSLWVNENSIYYEKY